MTAQASLLDDLAPPPGPSFDDQILAVELWMLGLRDWVERFTASRKRSEDEIARKRHQLAMAGAVVATLRSIRAPGGATT